MTSADLQNFVAQKPFRPFKMIVSDKTTYEIRSADLLWVGLASAMVVVPLKSNKENNGDKPLMEKTIYIDLRHILKVEIEEPQPIP